MLLFSGFMRISLAGDDLSKDMLGFAYLFGSEFLGVQASIGWAMEYFSEGYPASFWAFGATLQDFYKSSVGHGLATSPGAFLRRISAVRGYFFRLLAAQLWRCSFGSALEWLVGLYI